MIARDVNLGELKNLNYLEGTLQIKGLENVVDVCEAKNAQLKKKIHLHHLYLWFDKEYEKDRRMENDVLVLNSLESPPDLEFLSIDGYQGTIISPNWTMSLTKLKTLFLTICSKLVCLPPLGKLPFLESLQIWHVDGLKKVGVEFLGIESKNEKDNIIIFPNLKSLVFGFLEEWGVWIGIGGMREREDCVTIMPCLHYLRIHFCPKVKSLPDFLCTTPLKELEIDYSPILTKHCKKGTREDWHKISHILNIRIHDDNV